LDNELQDELKFETCQDFDLGVEDIKSGADNALKKTNLKSATQPPAILD
jgi:hypothetical protein